MILHRSIAILFGGLPGLAAAAAGQEETNLNVSVLVDGYYSWNANHPFTAQNQLHLFDVAANTWNLSLARVAVDGTPRPLSFHVELGAGKAYRLMQSLDTSPRVLGYIPQAYLKWKPAALAGLQLDFGKFYTCTGIEVLDTDQNWNYSRSLLFSWAQPAFHFGLRSAIPVRKNFLVGVQLVNGWNNVRDNNSGKSVGLTSSLSSTHVTWSNVYYVGPEKTGTNQGWRHLYDTSLLVTPAKTVSLYVNADYAVDRRLDGGDSRWGGVGGAIRFSAGPKAAITPRVEWFSDPDGFATGTPQTIQEITLTGEWKLAKGLTSRLEVRRDWSGSAIFAGRTPASPLRSQTTFLVGLLAHISVNR